MDIGDVVRLKRPFQPEPPYSKTYEFAIIVGFIQDDDLRPQPNEVVVYLYEPNTSMIYTDEMGSQSLFYFGRNELIE